MLQGKLFQSFSRLKITRNIVTQCYAGPVNNMQPCLPPPSTYNVNNTSVDISNHKQNFYLPSTNHALRKSILEPISSSRFVLPSTKPVEKLTPTIDGLPIAIEEPTNQINPSIIKHAMPWLIGVRHRKMKKHKLKKFRKRMLFVFRKRKLMKLKKKEREIVIEEDNYKKEGENFNARDFIDQEMELARKAGWGVNIIQNGVLNK